MNHGTLTVSNLGVYRVGRGAFCSALLFGTFACEPQDIVLGRGDSDAGLTASSSPADPSSEPMKSALAAQSNSSAAASIGVSSSSTADTSSGSSADEASSSSDACLQAQASCLENTPGTMCKDVLILCRVALPDGGPPCEDVYAQCVDMGYSAEDCEHAVATCEGEPVVLGTDVDSTFRAGE